MYSKSEIAANYCPYGGGRKNHARNYRLENGRERNIDLCTHEPTFPILPRAISRGGSGEE